MAMSKYENIIWEEKMKEKIMSHAGIVYAEELLPSSHFHIIIAQEKKSDGGSFYTTSLLVIYAPVGTGYEVLFSTRERETVGDGLEAMLEILQQKVAPLLKEQMLAADKESHNPLSDNSGKTQLDLLRELAPPPRAKRVASAT
ncbi:hypothetical protein J4E83_010003 [Alternaria metachromatica]|uniref:uncharacterized protein n=1 Tax=Alternaria metachromatica TaxID=283354 RepID=UPI0020C2A109|nr:uncharacterized protein J4E83_010003 [Alternaria metachromatica]KAI4606631.1 hypothetical protein J4E83_010003 [Alternaria metachromatica]